MGAIWLRRGTEEDSAGSRDDLKNQNKLKIDFMVGTMIELPRAAIKAKEIAKQKFIDAIQKDQIALHWDIYEENKNEV